MCVIFDLGWNTEAEETAPYFFFFFKETIAQHKYPAGFPGLLEPYFGCIKACMTHVGVFVCKKGQSLSLLPRREKQLSLYHSHIRTSQFVRQAPCHNGKLIRSQDWEGS